MHWSCLPIVLASLFYLITPAIALKSRVFGARHLRHDVHKYLVSLVMQVGTYEGQCSGSIIHHRWVITSAHCFDVPPHVVHVLHFTRDHLEAIAEMDPKDVRLHPKYSEVNDDDEYIKSLYDLALLKTKAPIKFDQYTRPIRLASVASKPFQSAIISGYGEAEPYKSRPREGAVVIRKCRSQSTCTVDLARAGDGDSGGALVSKGHLVGVTSASCIDVIISKPCMTLYADVYTSSRWIKKIMSS